MLRGWQLKVSLNIMLLTVGSYNAHGEVVTVTSLRGEFRNKTSLKEHSVICFGSRLCSVVVAFERVV